MQDFLFSLLIFIGSEEQRYDQNEETGHKHEHRHVVRRHSMHKSGEHIVSPLDDGCFVVKSQVRESRSRVVDLKGEYTESLGRSELQGVNSVALVRQRCRNVRIQHLERKLHICSLERLPLAFGFLVDGYEILDCVLYEVVFRVDTLVISAYFPVLDIARHQHT